MEPFPTIHTNFWDSLIAVPAVVLATQAVKTLVPVPRVLVPTVANVIGLAFALFIAHRYHIWAAIFMGFFYGNAAVGVYASMKTTIMSYRGTLKKTDP